MMRKSDGAVNTEVFFTMVLHPAQGWIRVGEAYATREIAQGWLPFVRGAWRGLRVKTRKCPMRIVDGELDEATRERLDKVFNLDPPDSEGLARYVKFRAAHPPRGEKGGGE